MNLSFRQLRVFLEVAQQGSVTLAAARLHLTPPAVSMQIKAIESQVDLRLFDRDGRRLALSTAGEYFAVQARRMLGTLRDAENAMAHFKSLDRGQLTVAMVSTAKYFVPRLLAGFREEHPGIDVRLTVAANREALLRILDEGEAELAVMGRPPRDLAARAEPFAAHPMLFVCPDRHPLMAMEQPEAESLTRFPLIVREPGSGTRSAMEAYFAEHRVVPQFSMEMSSNETIKQAVIAGLGVSFLSLHTLWLELRSGLLHIVELPGTPVMRTWNVVRLQSKVLSPAAEAFRYYVLEHAEALLLSFDQPLLAQA